MKKSGVKQPVHYDIAIIGGGPTGLAFAASLRHTSVRLCLIEKQSESKIAEPTFDGRDTALTHSSLDILDDLGILPRISKNNIAPIKQASVINGISSYALNFDSRDENKDALGYLVSNYLIRKAAYDSVKPQKNLDILTDFEVTSIEKEEAHNTIHLSNGHAIHASLVVAADSRFSKCRTMMGVPVSMRDFGRTVVVARMKHDKPHNQIAFECFHYGRTLAVLPLHGNTCSVVITLPSDQVPDLLALPTKDFNQQIAERFEHRLGAMELITNRHSYPLVATYADRFVGHRFALLGDAAVGMHPVTAHGYNFGLYGVKTLSEQIVGAIGLGQDIASPAGLKKFNTTHRRNTLPIYLGTNIIVGLFTDERPAAKAVRGAVLRAGNLMKPFKQLITKQLTQTAVV
jgi:hypothetical protein